MVPTPRLTASVLLRKMESIREGEHPTGVEGNDPIVGTFLPTDVVSSRTEDTSPGEGTPIRKR